MKKSIPTALFIITIILFSFLFTLGILADGEETDEPIPYFLVNYYTGDTLRYTDRCDEGSAVTIRNKYSNVTGSTFYGWFSDDGVFYESGTSISFTKDTRLYEAWGLEVSTRAQLQDAIYKGWNGCARLTADITSTSRFNLPWGVAVIDLNGHNLTISGCDDAFAEVRGGLVIVGEGTINFTTSNRDKAYGALCSMGRHGYGDGSQRLWIGKDVKINTDGALVEMYRDISPNNGLPTVRIYGEVSCFMLVNSQGMREASLDIYNGAKVTVSGRYMFRDTSTIGGNLMNVRINGGDIFMGENTEFTDEPDRYSIDLLGGRYSKNISQYVTTEYRCTQDSDNMYVLSDNYCSSPLSPDGYHKYRASDITVTCEQSGKIFYKCQYCDDEYELQRLALGHNFTSVLTKEIVNNLEKTECGEYTLTCVRCGSTFTEYFYPVPSEAYVTIKVRVDGEESSYRVKASQLFIFDENNSTMLKTFLRTNVSVTLNDGTKKNFKPSEIIGIEIPLGTTAIYGDVYTGGGTFSPLGVFYDDPYLEEITIPQSVETVQKYAFSNMKSIKSIKGIEYISSSIGQNAFEQLPNSELQFQELVINSANIEANAFKNVKATVIRFTENVRNINSNSFATDAEISIGLREILLDANKEYGENGITLREFNDRYGVFTSIPSAAEFSAAIVYSDHNYVTTQVPATCAHFGYTSTKCDHCGDEIITNVGSTLDKDRHTYGEELRYIAPTCHTTGGNFKVCVDCGSLSRVGDVIPIDPDNHVLEERNFGYDICTEWFDVRKECIYGDYEDPQENWVTHEPLGHDFSIVIEEVPANCGQEGYIRSKCSRCDEENTEILPITGRHSAAEDSSLYVEPTCVKEGQQVFICMVCGKTVNTRVLPKNPDAHNWEATESAPDSEGIITIKYTCKNGCGTEHTPTSEEPHYRIDPNFIRDTQTKKLPVWAIVLICIGGVIILLGVGATIFFTLFKKKNKSQSYKYKFNTLNKK